MGKWTKLEFKEEFKRRGDDAKERKMPRTKSRNKIAGGEMWQRAIQGPLQKKTTRSAKTGAARQMYSLLARDKNKRVWKGNRKEM